MILVQLALVFFWATQGNVYVCAVWASMCEMIFVRYLCMFSFFADVVSCVDLKTPRDVLTVGLGDSLTLNCTYNCSTGFVRGCWSTPSNKFDCQGDKSSDISFCTVSLSLSNVSSEDFEKNYTCYTEETDDPRLSRKTERIISLKLQGKKTLLIFHSSLRRPDQNMFRFCFVQLKEPSQTGQWPQRLKIVSKIHYNVAIKHYL